MLGRTANNVYWMARYVERAENLARLLASTYHMSLLPASGGVGVTTLAIQTAMLLLNSRGSRMKPSTCLVDLDFQHGNVSDYLDLEPRLNLGEIEPSPERLDRQAAVGSRATPAGRRERAPRSMSAHARPLVVRSAAAASAR